MLREGQVAMVCLQWMVWEDMGAVCISRPQTIYRHYMMSEERIHLKDTLQTLERTHRKKIDS